MREIKFRAWDPTNNKMVGTWLGSVGFTDGDAGRLFQRASAMIDDHSNYQGFDWILMQYTGLKDRDGKEIYEGDFVKLDNDEMNKYFINWMSDPIIEVKIDFNSYRTSWDHFSEYGRVIGNIYENPELLTSH